MFVLVGRILSRLNLLGDVTDLLVCSVFMLSRIVRNRAADRAKAQGHHQQPNGEVVNSLSGIITNQNATVITQAPSAAGTTMGYSITGLLGLPPNPAVLASSPAPSGTPDPNAMKRKREEGWCKCGLCNGDEELPSRNLSND